MRGGLDSRQTPGDALTNLAEILVEREEALAAIDEHLDAVASSEGSVLAIQAAAGLGKTTVLEVVRERATERGLRVAKARGADLERDFSFGVVRQLLEPCAARATVDRRRELFDGSAQLAAPILAASSPVAASSAGRFGEAVGPAMHGLYWLAINLSERGPLLLCVDDAHWADAPSLRWLHYLARRLEGSPVGVVLAVRPGEPGADSDLLNAVAAEPITRLVQLEPLSVDGARAVVRHAIGPEADDQFCDACHAVTGGNPFLLRELAGALARDGVEPSAASVPHVRGLAPEAVTRSLVLRLARLPQAAGPLARAVAVLGGTASLRDAIALAELDEREGAHAADALAAVAILSSELPLEFRHPLLRAAVYRDLPAAERAIWHARAARILAAAGAQPERVAAQLLRAEPSGDAWVVGCLREAAGVAMGRGDPSTAIAFLRRAFVEPPRSDERVALIRELLRSSFLAADPHAGAGLGIDWVTEITNDPAALNETAFYLVMQLWVRGQASQALAVLEQARAAAANAGDHDVAIHLEVRWLMLSQMLPQEALQRLERHSSDIEPDSFAGRLLNASVAWYGSLAAGRSAAQTAQLARRAFANGRLVSELADDDLILGGYVLALLRTDDLEFCERVIERTRDEARARGSAPAAASASYYSGYLAHLRGDLMTAEGHIRAAVTAFRQAGGIGTLPQLTALLVDTLTDRGELDLAQSELAAAGMDDDIPEHWWFEPLRWSRGYLRLAQRRSHQAIEDLTGFGMRCERDGLAPTVTRPWASHVAPLLAASGDRERARRLADHELDQARAWGTPRVIGQALRGIGLVTDGPDGIELLRESARTLERSPARLEHARALIDLGAALRRANHRAEAREPLRRGLDLAHRCRARLLTAHAETELRATGARPRRLIMTGLDALTASERRVAEMAADGLTNREIAQALFVTTKTIETHIAHVFQKLDIASRTQLQPLIQGALDATERT